MKYITEAQMEKLDMMFYEGRLRGLPGRTFNKLSYSEAEQTINLAREVAPGTFIPITDEIRSLLKELSAKGVFKLEEIDLKYMTMATAYGLLWIAARQNMHRQVATSMQCQKIRKMISMGFLEYMPNWKICLLQYAQAEELIKEGEGKASLLMKG